MNNFVSFSVIPAHISTVNFMLLPTICLPVKNANICKNIKFTKSLSCEVDQIFLFHQYHDIYLNECRIYFSKQSHNDHLYFQLPYLLVSNVNPITSGLFYSWEFRGRGRFCPPLLNLLKMWFLGGLMKPPSNS